MRSGKEFFCWSSRSEREHKAFWGGAKRNPRMVRERKEPVERAIAEELCVDSLRRESAARSGVCRNNRISPCQLRELRVSVLKLLRKGCTTEARRTRRSVFPTDSSAGSDLNTKLAPGVPLRSTPGFMPSPAG